MQPKFGTSGLRGLSTALTASVISDYVASFLSACDVGRSVYIGQDLRTSSPRLARIVADAVCAAGYTSCMCGPCTTPALALAAQTAEAGAIMVTGSHIPADRNGLKFYSTGGEITKQDEIAILRGLDGLQSGPEKGARQNERHVMSAYYQRYTAAFAGLLNGMRIGVYAHSAVGRDDLGALLAGLGGDVTMLGRSETFVPVDTEAVEPHVRKRLRNWAHEHRLDAIVSTDADGDRPLLTDAAGCLVPGDLLGQITARALGADHVVTPISSNSGVSQQACFDKVTLTKIGSPYVLAAMAQAQGRTVGYEANGGFILGFEVKGISPLLTRDALLPLLTVLSLARDQGVAALVAQEPARVTASDRLQNVLPSDADAILRRLRDMPQVLLPAPPVLVDQTDGLRFTFSNGDIMHLRLSGNAPELRIYAEAGDHARAQDLLKAGMTGMSRLLQG